MPMMRRAKSCIPSTGKAPEPEQKPLTPEELKKRYPELAKMTMGDIVGTKEFERHFGITVRHTRGLSLEASFRLGLTSLDKSGLLQVERFREEFLKCLDKVSTESHVRRSLIVFIGMNAYNGAIVEIMKKYDEQKSNDNGKE